MPEKEDEGRGYGKGLKRWERIKNETISIRIPRGMMNEVRDLAASKDASLGHVFREAVQFYLQYKGNPEAFEAEMRESMRKDLLTDPDFIGLLRKLVKE